MFGSILLAGCGGNDSDELGTGSSASTDESTEGTGQTEADESSSTTENGGEGAGSASSTSSTQDESDTSGDTDSGLCPDNPNASACDTCLAESCCEQLMACESSESCTCMVACVEEGNEQLACLLQCQLDLPDLAYTQLSTCIQSMCAQECA
jgi:hypothetical protein